MFLTILRWWLSIEVVGLLALPLTALLFRSLPLRGYAFSKTLGLLLLGYGSWLLAILELAPFGGPAVLLTLLLIAGGSWWALGPPSRHELLAELRTRWRAVLAFELLFALALFAGLWLRWHGATGAAIIDTEKPMELAFLAGILRSDVFPPHDPWLAGFSINYYYLGYVVVAVLAVLGGTSAAEAFNLGVATVFALTGLMIAGVVTALIEATQPKREERPSRRRWLGRAAAALLGIVLVLVAGNQMGALQKIFGTREVVALDGGQLVQALVAKLEGAETVKLSRSTPKTELGEISSLTPQQGSFDWWWPSRAVWNDSGGEPPQSRVYAITEFPFFSFYLGDMHPHVLALPFGLLALALAMATALRRRPPAFLADRQGRLDLLLTGMIIGSIYAINSWDAPTYALLYSGALALLYGRAARESGAAFDRRSYLISLGSVALVALVLIAPFLLTFRSLAGNSPVPEPLAKIPIISLLGKFIAPSPHHTGLHTFLIIFGLFFVILLAYSLSAGRQRAPAADEPEPQEAARVRSPLLGWLWAPAALLLGLAVGIPLLALMPVALLLCRDAWQSSDQPVRAFVLWASAVGALIILGADLVYIRDHFEGWSPRLNTVFKFYYQAWLIWGTLTAYAAWALLRPPLLKRAATLLWLLPAAVLLAGALVYPLATPWNEGQPTLDGLAYLQQNEPDEAAAIDWLRQHARSKDVILTAVGESYDSNRTGSGRVAAATGLQTLLGWVGSHERLWRSGSPQAQAAISARQEDVPTIYTTNDTDVAQALLEKYDVDFVYIGRDERHLYDGPGLHKFGRFLELAFEQGQVQIFRVQPRSTQPVGRK